MHRLSASSSCCGGGLKLQAVETGISKENLLQGSQISIGSHRLDAEPWGLKDGWIYLIKGAGNAVDLFLYSSMVMNTSQTGRRCIFVDCGNSFDPYLISRICRTAGLEDKMILQSVLISRPFTAYQLNTLLQEDLAGALRLEPAMVIFSRPLSLFYSDDVSEKDGETILKRFVRDFEKFAGAHYPLVLAHDTGRLKGLSKLVDVADAVFNILCLDGQRMEIELEKYPEKQSKDMEILLSASSQTRLEDYLEAC